MRGLIKMQKKKKGKKGLKVFETCMQCTFHWSRGERDAYDMFN